MKTAIKSLVWILAFCMVLTLAACGGSGAAPSSAPTPAAGSAGTEGATSSFAQSAPASSADPADPTSLPEAPEGADGVLVAYFSATGTTRGVAEEIARLTGGELYEILPAVPYTSEDLDYNNDQSRATTEMNDPDARPEIAGEALSLEGYSTVFLGYPIWWGNAPHILSTFVESYDFDGLTVIPFCTSGSSGIGQSGSQLEQQAGSGVWLPGQRFGGNVTEDELQVWLDGLS